MSVQPETLAFIRGKIQNNDVKFNDKNVKRGEAKIEDKNRENFSERCS